MLSRLGRRRIVRFDFLHDAPPPLIDGLRSLRLPRRLYAPVVAGATVLASIAAAGGVEALRVRDAQSLESRVQVRFERSRTALARERLQWQVLDQLVARDRRLREVRLSGAIAAKRIAAMGNAFPPQSWVTSMTATAAAGYALKGYAGSLPVLEGFLDNIIRDRTIGRAEDLRVSREDRGGAGLLSFEVRVEAAP